MLNECWLDKGFTCVSMGIYMIESELIIFAPVCRDGCYCTPFYFEYYLATRMFYNEIIEVVSAQFYTYRWIHLLT